MRHAAHVIALFLFKLLSVRFLECESTSDVKRKEDNKKRKRQQQQPKVQENPKREKKKL